MYITICYILVTSRWPSGMRVGPTLGKHWFDSRNCNCCSNLVTDRPGCQALEFGG